MPARKRPNRWLIMAAYWLVQAAVLVGGGLFYYGSVGEGHWDPISPREFLEGLTDRDMLGIIAVWLPLLTLLQFLLVLPVHLPLPITKRGKGVHLAMAAAAAFIALLVLAFVTAASELVVMYGLVGDREWSWPTVWLGLGLSWAVFTALLVAYARRSPLPNDLLLTRVARAVFAGTVIETAALIPIDVMVRRKADCYCWAGSLVALILSGAIGVVVAGPAVFLPLLTRRPLWLRQGRCQWCGYDRAGLPADSPCPECGEHGSGDQDE